MLDEVVLQSVIGVTLVTAVAGAIDVAGRRIAAPLRSAVWRVALAALWSVPAVALIGQATHVRTYTVAVPLPAERRGTSVPSASSAAVPEGQPAPAASGRSVPGPSAAAPAARMPSFSPLVAALTIWAAGAILGLLLLARSMYGVHRLLGSAGAIGGPDLEARVVRWSWKVGLRGAPRLLESPRVTGPTVAGVLRPAMLFPSDRTVMSGDLDAVIIHELAHLTRSDLVVQGVARLTRAIWWWHPLAWLMVHQLTLCAEEACDDWAVSLTGDRRMYAAAVVRWAEAASPRGDLGCTLTGRPLTRRVRRILEGATLRSLQLSRRGRLGLGLCALLVVLSVGLLRVHGVTAEGNGSEAQAVTVDYRLVEALEAGDVAGVETLLDAGVSPNGRLADAGTPLHAAVASGHTSAPQLATLLVDHGANVGARDSEGRTPLHVAVASGGRATPYVAELLLDHGADVNAADNEGKTPMHFAAALPEPRGPELIWLLRDHGGEIDAADLEGRTPLHVAAEQPWPQVAQTLLESGANVNARDMRGATPLHAASRGGSVQVARLLLERGATVTATDDDGTTPLHLAALARDDDVGAALVRLLVDHGAAVDAKDRRGNTPLCLCAGMGSLMSARVLLDHGANARCKGALGFSVLETVAMSRRQESKDAFARLLISRGAQWTLPAAVGLGDTARLNSLLEQGGSIAVGTPVGQGFTLLHLAALSGQPDAAAVLLAHGADPNVKDDSGETPTHIAAAGGELSVLQRLCDGGADPNAVDAKGRTPLDKAIAASGGAEAAAFLLQHGAKWTLEAAALLGNEDQALALLAEGADPKGRGLPCGTPLHIASGLGHSLIVQALLEAGADVHAGAAGGATPLHFAAAGARVAEAQPAPQSERIQVARMLLEHGADVNATDGSRHTALDYASRKEPEMAQLLLGHGAKPTANGGWGRGRSGAEAPEAPSSSPGTATITVTARGPNGERLTEGGCSIDGRSDEAWRHQRGESKYGPPIISGTPGDWTIYNVGPGEWGLIVDSPEFAWTANTCTWRGEVHGPGTIHVNLTLSRGGDITGRVTAADTGRPLARAQVWAAPTRLAWTAADGRYVIRGLPPGERSVTVYDGSRAYAPRRGPVFTVKAGTTTSLPDIAMNLAQGAGRP